MLTLRPYQQEAIDALNTFLCSSELNPCVVLPTGAGKSLVMASAIDGWKRQYPPFKCVVLAHRKELVEQNYGEFMGIVGDELFGGRGWKVGVYSAGLDSRETDAPVIVAGIQSVYNKIEAFRPFDLVMIDEVHMVPPDGEGRYRTFLEAAKRANPRVRLVGWTATPYRTQGGLICKPENLLNEVCYEVGVKELINRGYISNITAKAGRHSPDTDGLHIRAGEFVAEDVEKLMGEDRLVSSACEEIVRLTKDRQACLVFCTSVAHCRKVASMIKKLSGEECAIVTGDTPADEREETIRRLRGETVKEDFFTE